MKLLLKKLEYDHDIPLTELFSTMDETLKELERLHKENPKNIEFLDNVFDFHSMMLKGIFRTLSQIHELKDVLATTIKE